MIYFSLFLQAKLDFILGMLMQIVVDIYNWIYNHLCMLAFINSIKMSFTKKFWMALSNYTEKDFSSLPFL